MDDETITLHTIVSAKTFAQLQAMVKVEGLSSIHDLTTALIRSYLASNGYGIVRRSLLARGVDSGLAPIGVYRDAVRLWVIFRDGRQIAHPLKWYPWLEAATDAQFADRTESALLIYWPALEDGIAIETLLKGPRHE